MVATDREAALPTQLTDYQAKYLAYELTRRAAPDSLDRLASAVAGAQVDLNPHQVDAALFAFKSPLSKGALLADEVGLGKTIEAGLVLSQHWAERKRRLLVIVPANLRKQWHQELTEKFFLPCQILESKSYNQAMREGRFQPFHPEDDAVIICSYQFARAKAGDVAATPWDLVVIDEAHRLRNVYQPSKVVANTIKMALRDRPKLLLTATPLQNSLLELYGLISLIDDHAFGDVHSFRDRFMGAAQASSHDALKARLQPLCTRTLRRQVRGYISYTNRLPLVQEFTPAEAEDTLYELVSEYLRRPNLQALPTGQRSLMTLVLRKLLASSTFAIAGALATMSNRLRRSLGAGRTEPSLDDELSQDYEALDETRNEWPDDPATLPRTPAERAAIAAEITFGGFQRCLQPVQKFQSDSERLLAIILDREAEKWFKPAPGQFQIGYRLGAVYHDYQPDFVAELTGRIVMLEPKRRSEMDAAEVLAKRDAAIAWCQLATKHAATYGGKPWAYALIPHDAISENQSLTYLLDRWPVPPPPPD